MTFESWDALAQVLSGKRLELPRQARRRPPASVAELARARGRDYKRVYEDVEILSAAGLLDRTDDGAIRTAYDEIHTSISLTDAA